MSSSLRGVTYRIADQIVAINSSDSVQSELLAQAARIAILVLAGAMALQQMGIADQIVAMTRSSRSDPPRPSPSSQGDPAHTLPT